MSTPLKNVIKKSSVLLAVLATPFTSYADLRLEDSIGPTTDPVPYGAKVIPYDKFLIMMKKNALVLQSPEQDKIRRAQAEKEFYTDKWFVEQQLQNDPDFLNSRAIDPNQPRNSDGSTTYTFKNNAGKIQKTTLLGDAFTYGSIAHSLRNFPTKENQLAIYQTLYKELPEAYRAKLTHPAKVQYMDVAQITNLNDRIVKDADYIAQLIAQLPPPPPPSRPACANEMGAGSWIGDSVGNNCAAMPTGLFNAVNFPLKQFQTCARNQGMRGSCVSFAITSSMETQLARRYNQWWNLSEQQLYQMAKLPWFHDDFYDGLWTDQVGSRMVRDRYFFFPESSWPYNVSLSRVDAGWWTWRDSCVGYPDARCSDTAHQTQRFCTENNGSRWCGYGQTVTGGTSFTYASGMDIWNHWDRYASLRRVQLFLSLGIPVVLSHPVTPAWDNVGSNGLMYYVGRDGWSRGGHATTIMGYVSDRQIPPGFPWMPGGYYIIKNSWSNCQGDASYMYVPEMWLRDQTNNLYVLQH